MKKLFAAALCTLPLIAGASVIIGNPNTKVTLVAGSSVYLHSVEGHRCGAGTDTLSVGKTLSTHESTTVGFAETKYCSVDVNVRWTPGGSIKTVPVTGFSIYQTVVGKPVQSIDIDATTGKAFL